MRGRAESLSVRALACLVLLASGTDARSQMAERDEADIGRRVQEGMNLNFEGRFDAADEVWQSLSADYPLHPAGALYAGETLFWRQLYDLFDRGLDAEIESMGRQALSLADDWRERSPLSAEAALFAGQAEIQLGRLDGLLKRYYAAGRHAERAQSYLELALEIDSELIDARYWLGLYSYYASTLNEVLRMLSWLWFIPEPDGPGGIEALYSVRQSEGIQRHAATLALMNIYTYYETDYERAEFLARELNVRYPNNSLIHFELLRILLRRNDFVTVIEEARRLESRSLSNELDRGRATMAQVWRARATFGLGRLEEAEAILDSVEETGPDIPTWGPGWMILLRGQLAHARGNHDVALDHFERAATIEDDSPDAARRAREELRLRR